LTDDDAETVVDEASNSANSDSVENKNIQDRFVEKFADNYTKNAFSPHNYNNIRKVIKTGRLLVESLEECVEVRAGEGGDDSDGEMGDGDAPMSMKHKFCALAASNDDSWRKQSTMFRHFYTYDEWKEFKFLINKLNVIFNDDNINRLENNHHNRHNHHNNNAVREEDESEYVG